MTVININDLRITHERNRRWARDACKHLNLTFDDNGEIVQCDDCGKQVSAYWAITMLASHYSEAMHKLAAGTKTLADAKAKDITLLSAQRVEKAWRSRSMVPTCPHCGEGITSNDGLGAALINRDIDARRKAARAAAAMAPDSADSAGRGG
ncbi:MAG: hypothetical protein EOO27_31550 [Comamonadaceae bacterium]|nr:MAG: hypothetical protein EOO27_31550 [Comamonadaceae bacterium]